MARELKQQRGKVMKTFNSKMIVCVALGLSLGYNGLTLAEESEDESPYLTNVLEESYPIDNKYRLCVYSGGEEVVIKINKRCPQVNR